MQRDLKKVLTIAGSDSSGGAGIQADLKTMGAHDVYGMSAITSLTAQNTTGVIDILDATPEFLGNELDAIFTDIFPDAVKIGMVSKKELIEKIAEKLSYYNAKNIVVDPVMVATSGSKLLDDSAIESLINKLFPLATVITPNIPEAEILASMEIKSRKDMEVVAEKISDGKLSVLLKGGHNLEDANDLLYKDGELIWFNGMRIDNDNTHGTGCTLSSAIASNLAKGYTLEESVENAKRYLEMILKSNLDLGNGSGPLDHFYKN